MQYLKTRYRFPKHAAVVPIISSVIIPLVILDVWMEIYHRTCFPLYGKKCIDRDKYIKIMDRFKLPYLTTMQKLYCAYCGYGNGVIKYWAEIAAETESYWCGIQHEKNKHFMEQEHQKHFAEYGNKEDFEEKYLRKN